MSQEPEILLSYVIKNKKIWKVMMRKNNATSLNVYREFEIAFFKALVYNSKWKKVDL